MDLLLDNCCLELNEIFDTFSSTDNQGSHRFLNIKSVKKALAIGISRISDTKYSFPPLLSFYIELYLYSYFLETYCLFLTL